MVGSSNEIGEKYFMDEDIVLVTINYRLGAFGMKKENSVKKFKFANARTISVFTFPIFNFTFKNSFIIPYIVIDLRFFLFHEGALVLDWHFSCKMTQNIIYIDHHHTIHHLNQIDSVK